MQNHFRLKALVAALGLVAASTSFAGTTSASSALFTSIRPATQLRQGDTVVGPLAFSQPLHVVIALKLRNPSGLQAFLATPGHKTLSPQEFAAQYSPTAAQAQSVAAYLTKAGFTNVTIAPNNLLVEADGRADTAQTAFNTSLVHVHTHDGRDAFANATDVKIPTSLQDSVLSVLGVENVHLSHTFVKYAKTNAVHTNASGTAAGHNPTTFASIYGASSLASASTVPVGIIVEGSLTNILSDLKTFASSNGLPAVSTQVVGSGGSDTSGDGEWDLDSQDIVGISGGVQKIIFYDTTSLTDANLTSDYNAAVTANAVKVINVSLGECETDAQSAGTTTAEDQVFEQAVAQGQTFSVSAGDSGADECGTGGTTPSWPASSQYVVAVGGTELYTSGNTWTSETVWNNLSEDEGATGGSPSTFEPQPSWQSGVGQNAGHTTRGVPDIAFDASPDSGALVIVDGQTNQQIGGTSLASPLFVGSWARIQAANGGNLGFAAPLIYKAAAANYASDFHDVTSGNNSGETAATGWDYTTGFGSLIVSALSSNISSSGSGGGGGSTSTPVANFTDTVSGLTATFTNSSTDTGGTITSYAWNFGDSGTSTSASPSHTYTAAGTYTVTLQVTDSTGATNTKTGSVTVSSSGGGGGSNGVFTNNTAVNIGDNKTITSSIAVTGEPGNAPSALQVHVNITHNWSGDLTIEIIAPSGAYAVLQSPDYNDDGNINKTYTVNASSVTGNGTWKLKVIDNDPYYSGDYGTLNNWSLTF